MPNEPITAPQVDKWVKQFIVCRDWLKAQDDAHKARMADVKADMERLKGRLQAFLEQTKQESSKTADGSFFLTKKDTASLNDAQEFMRFVIGGEHWDLLDKKANVTAVRDFLEENQQLPPGVSFTTKVDVNVRRPTEK